MRFKQSHFLVFLCSIDIYIIEEIDVNMNNNKTKLVEITRGNIGTGLLIENDGYISMTEGDNKQLYESLRLNEDTGEFIVPNPFIVSAVFQKFGIENANGRIYPEDILKREVEKYQLKIKERRAYGECNHPSDSTIDLGRLAMNIIELHWENNTLVGKIEIPVSQGFRKLGIISCLADMVAHWILSKLKIGVSSRGLGSVEQRYGKLIVGDDFELVCWDVVSEPSTPGAWISKDSNELSRYIENIKKDDSKLMREDKFKKFNEWLGIL